MARRLPAADERKRGTVSRAETTIARGNVMAERNFMVDLEGNVALVTGTCVRADDAQG